MNGIIENEPEGLDVEISRERLASSPVKPPPKAKPRVTVKPAVKPVVKPAVKPSVKPPLKPPVTVRPPVKPPVKPSAIPTPVTKLPQAKFSVLESFVAPVLVSVTANALTGLLQFNHPANSVKNADDTVTYPNGSVANDVDGTITNIDGSVTHTNGKTVYLNGDVFDGSSGLFVFADGTTVQALRDEKGEWVFPTDDSADAPPHP
jgi:hypothetical protein